MLQHKPIFVNSSCFYKATVWWKVWFDVVFIAVTDSADPWYLQQTGKKLVQVSHCGSIRGKPSGCRCWITYLFHQRPEKLNQKPSVLPAVEVIAPGGSYNPDFLSHQVSLSSAAWGVTCKDDCFMKERRFLPRPKMKDEALSQEWGWKCCSEAS